MAAASGHLPLGARGGKRLDVPLLMLALGERIREIAAIGESLPFRSSPWVATTANGWPPDSGTAQMSQLVATANIVYSRNRPSRDQSVGILGDGVRNSVTSLPGDAITCRKRFGGPMRSDAKTISSPIAEHTG